MCSRRKCQPVVGLDTMDDLKTMWILLRYWKVWNEISTQLWFTNQAQEHTRTRSRIIVSKIRSQDQPDSKCARFISRPRLRSTSRAAELLGQ